MGKRITLPIAGGNWDNAANAGVFARNFNNASSNSNNNVGGADSDQHIKIASSDTVEQRDALSSDKRNLAGSADLSSSIENLSRQPKRIGHLFEIAFSKDNLLAAYYDAKRHKTKKPQVMAFAMNLGSELDALCEEIHSGEYRPGKMTEFHVVEHAKRRLIQAPMFRDLVVQHAIYRVIYPIFDRTFIAQSYGCRKCGGTHKASDYTQQAMRKHDGELYFVKMDIRKFFYSIDHQVLDGLLQRKLKDERLLGVMRLFYGSGEKGVPIGSLLSQLYALIALNPLDHFAKRKLKAKHYVRYVDDFVAIGLTLEEAKHFRIECDRFVVEVLRMEISHWMIAKIKRGINFVGYRTWKSAKFVRKHSITSFKRAVRAKSVESIASLIGHARHSASLNFYFKWLQKAKLISHLPKRIQKCLDTLNTRQRRMTLPLCAL